jgi:hypothetical protein
MKEIATARLPEELEDLQEPAQLRGRREGGRKKREEEGERVRGRKGE